MLCRVEQRSDVLYRDGKRVYENLVRALEFRLHCDSEPPASDASYFVLPHHLDEDGNLECPALDCVDVSLRCYHRCGGARMSSFRRKTDGHGPTAIGDFRQIYDDSEIPCEEHVEREGYVFPLS